MIRVMLPLMSTLLLMLPLSAAISQPPEKPALPLFDEELAKSVGADEHGMRRFVLVILKTGPTPVPEGPRRDEMFKRHFDNMGRLADAGVLAVAGPLDGVDGWRGLFVLAVEDIEAARTHVATDPVIIEGEMVAEYHRLFASAALMLVNGAHGKIQKKPF